MSQSLFAIGYAGHTPESFVATLTAAGVETLVDIRRRAASRKRGFAKSALAASLAAAGIGYVHLRELGVPEELRAELRAETRGRDWPPPGEVVGNGPHCYLVRGPSMGMQQ